jgi:hypothetical protein
MPYETAFPYNSETSSFWHGFFYSDPLRVYTNVFYNLGYHLSGWLGMGGSFLGFQLVYAALWWARGILAYLITSALFPRHRLLAILVGGLALVHASDHALNWVGQLNQFGMIFWMLLAFYALVVALSAESETVAVVGTLVAMAAARMSLWSYESPLFIILAFPLLVLLMRFRFSRRTSLVTGAFYLVPLLFIAENLRRYSSGAGTTYQASVLRDSFAPGPLLGDLWFNVKASVGFTSWGTQMPPVASSGERLALGLGGAALFAFAIAGAAWFLARRGDQLLPDRRHLVYLLGGGTVLLVLSFPAYVILTSSRMLWRTQFLSAVGAAAVLAAVIGLVATIAAGPKPRAALVAVLGGAIAYYGVTASFTMASFHYRIWERHRTAMAEVLGVAPNVKPGTLIVLTGVPKTADPFGDNMWFDVATRLAYPRRLVAGIYYYADGSAAPHMNMALRRLSWNAEAVGFPTLLKHVPFQNTLIVRWSASGRGTMLRRVPNYIDHGGREVEARYAPATRVVLGAASTAAVNRYEPIPS